MRSLDLQWERTGIVADLAGGSKLTGGTRRNVTHDTDFVTLFEDEQWIVGYYARTDDDGKYFLNIWSKRSGRQFTVDELVPAYVKSKYIFWKNMLAE